MRKVYLLLALVVVMNACAPSRFVQPLEKGQWAGTATLGGPLFQNFGAPIPLPLTSVAAGYGVQENVTAFAGIHTTSLLFGVLQTDIGVVREFINPAGWIPGVSVNLSGNISVYKNFDLETLRFWPSLEANAYWPVRQDKGLAYVGLNNWFELRAKKAFDEPQDVHWLPNIQAGYIFKRPKMNYTIETKYLAPNVSNEKIVVKDVDLIGGNGSLGIYFGITKKF